MHVMGLEAKEIVRRRKDGIIILAGIDENGKEALVVIPEGHFYGKLSIAKKGDRLVTGFKVETGQDTQTISN